MAIFPVSSTNSCGRAQSSPRFAPAKATARYMAPVSRKRKPSRSASARATVLFPAPAGPSRVTIIRSIVDQRVLAENGVGSVVRLTWDVNGATLEAGQFTPIDGG